VVGLISQTDLLAALARLVQTALSVEKTL
jgi:CBS-domain-containing membrane protein